MNAPLNMLLHVLKCVSLFILTNINYDYDILSMFCLRINPSRLMDGNKPTPT